MWQEGKFINETIARVEKILTAQCIYLIGAYHHAVDEYHFDNVDRVAALSVIAQTPQLNQRLLAEENVTDSFTLMMETYLDCLFVQRVIEMRGLNDSHIQAAKRKLGRHLPLTVVEKEAAYLGCHLENVIHNQTLETYHQYKRLFSSRLGS